MLRISTGPRPASAAEQEVGDSDLEITGEKEGDGGAAKEAEKAEEVEEEQEEEEGAEEEEVLGTAPNSPAAPDETGPCSTRQHESDEDLARRLQVRAV